MINIWKKLRPWIDLGVLMGGLCHAGASAAPKTALPVSARTYHYQCEFLIYDSVGTFQNKMKIEADHTRGLPKGMMRWNDATVAFGTTLEGSFIRPMPQDYMEGFSYPPTGIEKMLTGDFFKSFPPSTLAFLMKNAVIDVHMFDAFLTEITDLTLHVPRRAISNAQMTLFGDQGTQKLRRLDLTWIGDATVDGEPCRVIRFQSSLDAVTMTLKEGGQTASTVFGGDMCVSRASRQVVRGTLFEHTVTTPLSSNAALKDLKQIHRTVTLFRK